MGAANARPAEMGTGSLISTTRKRDHFGSDSEVAFGDFWPLIYAEKR
jgi:hypothetical protein